MSPRRHPPRSIGRLAGAVGVALACAAPAHAVTLGSNGLGQALIYPYYTVRASEGGNAFNTYLAVANSTGDAKALRVRIREGRAGREALDFNLYLGPNDMWSAALIPTGTGARLATTDTSCVDPPFPLQGGGTLRAVDLNNFRFSGAQGDGFGDTLDRTREGYVEVIEMATLAGDARAGVTHNAAGAPTNCDAVRPPTEPAVAAPTGGLFGSLTLINVNNGEDFTQPATALAELSTLPFYRYPADPYPGFTAAEVDPVSVVRAGGFLYRSAWPRPVDAVSAVLMRSAWLTEYVLDSPSASLSDVVITMPTRHHHVTANTFTAPFSVPGAWSVACTGEPVSVSFFNRDERGAVAEGCDCGLPPPPPPPGLCAAAAVASVRNGAPHMPPDAGGTAVLGSLTRGLRGGAVEVIPTFQNGWMLMAPAPRSPAAAPLVSLPQSSRIDLANGQAAAGPHTYVGLPMLGFMVRSFRNGTLACTGPASCQGNYGGAFAFRYRRSIAP